MDSQRQDQLEERYLDIHEAAQILEVSEDELWDLVRKNEIPHHNLAGAFLRFKKVDVDETKIKWRIQRELFPAKNQFFPHENTVLKSGVAGKIRDFWYFNDFYILCFILMVLLLYLIVSSQ